MYVRTLIDLSVFECACMFVGACEFICAAVLVAVFLCVCVCLLVNTRVFVGMCVFEGTSVFLDMYAESCELMDGASIEAGFFRFHCFLLSGPIATHFWLLLRCLFSLWGPRGSSLWCCGVGSFLLSFCACFSSLLFLFALYSDVAFILLPRGQDFSDIRYT